MNNLNQVGEFPVCVLPDPLQKLITHIQGETQAPVGLIASTALGVMALACQDSFDVQPKDNLRFAVSLYLIVLAESGERKSTVDKLLMKAVYEVQHQLEANYVQLQTGYQSDLAVWKIKEKTLEKAISKAAERGVNTKELEEAWRHCLEQKPTVPRQNRLVLSDVTSAAIKQTLGNGCPSLTLASDEAGSLLSGDLFRDTALNSMWSGNPILLERAASTSVQLEDYRLGMMLMLQPRLFTKYLERHGEGARSSGLLARCLICAPQSTQGQRFNFDAFRFRDYNAVDNFHRRVAELLTGAFKRRERGLSRRCLKLTPEAASRWNQHHRHVESQIGPLGQLSEYRDYASKFMEHVSRLAAVIEGFYTKNAELISDHSMYAAIALASWYFDHFIQQMKQLDKQDSPSNAMILLTWLSNNTISNGGPVYRKNDILKFGPCKLRSKKKLDEALHELVVRGNVLVGKINRTTFVEYKCGVALPLFGNNVDFQSSLSMIRGFNF